ncbi:DUF421 domain-containing protein [Halalkalibacterium ligniniphilum]|uniref:DUF421 domain-containing protein n=1 Tax=Halalkalibacterium ligniniphilum TaxID=1134413 RepID=UPI0004766E06|nr:DUF421 domain-containing protein [Halalkalibacterium ligniniphilum]
MPSWLEVALRSIGALVGMFVISKGLLRKSVGESSYFELMTAIAVAVIAGVGSIQLNIPVAFIIIAFIVWGLVPIASSIFQLKSMRYRNFINGKGIPIIKDGKIMEDNLKTYRMSTDELMRKLRSKNVFQVADVEFAVLESNGELNMMLKKEYQPLDAKTASIHTASIKEPEAVIMDGKVLDEPLATRGFNRQWLEDQLTKMEVAIENVFLGQVDRDGQLTVDLFDDQLQKPQSTELPLLLQSIKQSQADLETFSLDTDDPKAKELYASCAKEMERVKQMIEPYVK